MNRRDFASILGASLLIPSFSKGSTLVREKPFELNYAPHFGMFKNHAGPSELDQLQFMYDQGFTALEDNELMERPVALQEKIGEKLAKLNMKMGVFVIKFDGFFDKQTMTTGKKEWTDLFLASCRKSGRNFETSECEMGNGSSRKFHS